MLASGGLRTLAFGDLGARVWGTAWIPRGQAPAFVALGAGARSEPAAATLEGAGEDEEWHLEGDRTSLTLSPMGDAVVGNPGAAMESLDQLCRVRGRFSLHGAEYQVDCLGCRGTRAATPAAEEFESIRAVWAWFEPEQGLVLAALRPRNSHGHDGDLMTAAVLGDQAVKVIDPRLSTTYTAEGRPARAGLELWLTDPEREQDDAEEADGEEHQYPRRAAGEAVGSRVELSAQALEIEAELFRWHSRGAEGAGVYLLARLG